MRVIDHLVQSIRKTAEYNPSVQAPPFCILWPDKERQWEKVIPRLQLAIPELFVLGKYNPEERSGPAIWLRCVVAGTMQGVSLDKQQIPIFYLPGVSRQDLRAIEQCAEELKPLAELQYRSALWSQVNARDWSIFAYFKTELGGLGLDVAKDQASLNALHLALARLLDEDIVTFTQLHLDKEFFTNLLAGNDVAKDILQWLSDTAGFSGSRTEEERQAFSEVCRVKYHFDPVEDGEFTGVEKLAVHEGPWQQVWDRFCEAPLKYERIPALIRRTVMPLMGVDASSWPQWNEKEETKLRGELGALASMTSPAAREYLLQLEMDHGVRREWVWAELGEAQLAAALAWLAKIAVITQEGVADTLQTLIDDYSQSGWQADDAALHALDCVHKQEDVLAVTTALQIVYQPWLEDGAKQCQDLVRRQGYPGGTVNSRSSAETMTGECILFVDGLRFDLAKRLIELFQSKNLATCEKPYWAALPSITATGKPAVMPIGKELYGEAGNLDFEPSIQAINQIATGPKLHKILAESGWKIFSFDSVGDCAEKGWMEGPSIDNEGHHRGRQMVYQLDKMLMEIADKVQKLLANGWQQIRLVSDHGWLLMPGGLPKVQLPAALSDTMWSRCAMLKAGAVTDESLYPWYWNPHIQIAMPNGIRCYRSGLEYTHGGLSLQECLMLELTVGKATNGSKISQVIITDVVWTGMRCKVVAEGGFTGLSADLRLQPGNSDSSIAVIPKPFNNTGLASLIVEDDELEGEAVTIVLLDSNGQVVMQQTTTVGGDQ
ncbi:MAG: BREX-1 system phosphatase PglZ type B [Desulfitobacterium hafniense]|nr:BREX-1 system phosphatase PglZ type B [Desulfitobacterium hafniense]